MIGREERSVKDATGVSLFSFFAGSGIMDLAFEEAGYEVVYVNEYDTSFLSAYQYARAQIGIRPPRYGCDNVDIRMILNDHSALEEHMRLERNRGRIVGFIGGPPCPDFSVAGKNRGIDGMNGQLTAIFF